MKRCDQCQKQAGDLPSDTLVGLAQSAVRSARRQVLSAAQTQLTKMILSQV